MTAELKPCPFCGEEAASSEGSGHSTAWEIGCYNGQCPAEPHVWEKTKAQAITAWNTRADLVQAAVAAALREAINRVSGCDRVSEVQPAILALITEDAQAALDRVVAAEREATLDAASEYLGYQYGMSVLSHPVDRARIAAIREGRK